MSELLKGNAVVGQSGGPTAVINQSLVGVIEAAAGRRAIRRLLGARHGVRGIVAGDFIDLKGLPKALLERVAATPASALGSTRDKPDEAYCRRIFRVFAANNVRYFFYIGGNDSADTARIVNEMAYAAGHELRVFHIPKTIDNDLRVTDHCPGYGSAAKFVASAFVGDDRDSASLPGIKINVVMGRHAGWLTAAASPSPRSSPKSSELSWSATAMATCNCPARGRSATSWPITSRAASGGGTRPCASGLTPSATSSGASPATPRPWMPPRPASAGERPSSSPWPGT
ncbi:MAG: 6-phosphofructokinase [Planctomycetota bacterium]|jgi:6-phosphofructokinase 1